MLINLGLSALAFALWGGWLWALSQRRTGSDPLSRLTGALAGLSPSALRARQEQRKREQVLKKFGIIPGGRADEDDEPVFH